MELYTTGGTSQKAQESGTQVRAQPVTPDAIPVEGNTILDS
jgi:hypothetical protein